MSLDKSLLIVHAENYFWSRQAIHEIYGSFGDRVYLKPDRTLIKGASNDIGLAPEMIWNQGGEETDIASNSINKVSSSSAADTQEITVEGSTISGGVFTTVTQSVTLTGQTKATLTTPLARISAAYNIGATDLAGDVYIYEDDTITAGVPDTSSKVHLKINAGEQESAKGKITIADNEYLICSNFYASVGIRSEAIANFSIQVREQGKTYRTRFKISGSSPGGVVVHDFRPFLVIPSNSDVRIMAESGAVNTSVDAGIQGFIGLTR